MLEAKQNGEMKILRVQMFMLLQIKIMLSREPILHQVYHHGTVVQVKAEVQQVVQVKLPRKLYLKKLQKHMVMVKHIHRADQVVNHKLFSQHNQKEVNMSQQ